MMKFQEISNGIILLPTQYCFNFFLKLSFYIHNNTHEYSNMNIITKQKLIKIYEIVIAIRLFHVLKFLIMVLI